MQAELRKIGEYKIRRCEYKDIPSVIASNMRNLPENYSSYFFESILSEFPEAFLIAELSNEVVGYIMCKIEFGFSNFKKLGFVKKGHVVSIAVNHEHRGKKIGKALMEESISAMVAKKCDEVYLEVRISNSIAINLYNGLGFEIKSRLRGYYRDGEDAYLMALDLKPIKSI
ncbi:MAG: N-acetyltransferase [Candidatus Nitrosocaldaceae archaeon]